MLGKTLLLLRNLTILFFILLEVIPKVDAGKGEPFYDEVEGQKNYEEEERGKVAPVRTFLTTLEIVLICVFTIIGVFLIVGIIVYLWHYGCTLPKCCQRTKKDYTQAQLQRERKIGEIWKPNYQPI